jgi:ribonuclease BN (tRNA processing enzyme)
MLNFIGNGSAFNTQLGNTSAFIKHQHSLVIIDCGGTVFHQVKELKILDDVKQLSIIITHTHPDHVGSLGDLIFYAHFILKITPVLYYPNLELMKTYLKCVGVEEHMVKLISSKNNQIKLNDESIIQLNFIPIQHLHTVHSFALLLTIQIDNQISHIYYSGDANEIPEAVLTSFLNEKIKWIYQDTSGMDYEGNPHLSLKRLSHLIPKPHRHRVYCIHHDKHLDTNEVKSLGFQVPVLDHLKN